MAGEESDAADEAGVALEAEAAGDGGGAAALGFSFDVIGNTPWNYERVAISKHRNQAHSPNL